MDFRCAFVVFLIVLGVSLSHSSPHPEMEERALLKKAMEALRKGLQYMENNMLEVNLDGIFGIRLVEEHLLGFLKFDTHVFDAFEINFLTQIEELYRKAAYIANNAIENVKVQDPDYYEISSGFLEVSDVLLWYPSKDTQPNMRVNPLPCQDAQSYVPYVIKCFGEIFGIGVELRGRCNISQECFDFMTAPGMRHYHLTHQQLFFVELEMKNCLTRSRVKSIPESLRIELCSNIMRDAVEIAASDYPQGHQDLFVEQIGFCGLWGFRDFYNPEWLEAILEWQGKSGCYYHDGQPYGAPCSENLVEETKQGKSRVRKNEKIMSDYCLSHKTAFALTAITASIRFLAERIAASIGSISGNALNLYLI